MISSSSLSFTPFSLHSFFPPSFLAAFLSSYHLSSFSFPPQFLHSLLRLSRGWMSPSWHTFSLLFVKLIPNAPRLGCFQEASSQVCLRNRFFGSYIIKIASFLPLLILSYLVSRLFFTQLSCPKFLWACRRRIRKRSLTAPYFESNFLKGKLWQLLFGSCWEFGFIATLAGGEDISRKEVGTNVGWRNERRIKVIK